MLNVDNDSAADYVISTSQSDSCAGKMFNSTDDNQLTCCPSTYHPDDNNIECNDFRKNRSRGDASFTKESGIEKQKQHPTYCIWQQLLLHFNQNVEN